VVRATSTGAIEGLLEGDESGGPEFIRSIAISPDESKCAVVSGLEGQPKLIVWDLHTGKRIHEVQISSVTSRIWGWGLDGKIDVLAIDVAKNKQSLHTSISNVQAVKWSEDGNLLLKWMANQPNRSDSSRAISESIYSIYSPEDGRTLWNYRLPNGISFDDSPSSQIWFSEFANLQQHVVCAQVPTPPARERMKSAPKPKPLLKNNDTIVLDVSVNISGDQLADGLLQDQVKATVIKACERESIRVEDRAALKLSVRVTQVVNRDRSNSQPIVSFLATCSLTDISNEMLWERSGLVAEVGDPIGNRSSRSENTRKKSWDNLLQWLASNVEPTSMYERWYYEGLGESYLSSKGEKVIDNMKPDATK
jgi:hypothetical protein